MAITITVVRNLTIRISIMLGMIIGIMLGRSNCSPATRWGIVGGLVLLTAVVTFIETRIDR